MKNKTVLVFGLLLVVLLSFSSGVVLSQTSKELPRLETACETKAGLIHGFNDGFSILKKCSKGSRQVVLGEKASSSSGHGVNIGKIRFVDDDDVYVNMHILNDEGKVFTLFRGGESNNIWAYTPTLDLPSNVSVNNLVFWNRFSFMTIDGSVYYIDPNSDGMSGGWLGPFASPIK